MRTSTLSALTAAGLFAASCSNAYGGSIGAILGKDNRDGRLYVREIPEDMAAAKVGIREGDEITAIEGKSVRHMSVEEIHAALAGKVGSKVHVTVWRDGETLSFDVERGPLKGG